MLSVGQREWKVNFIIFPRIDKENFKDFFFYRLVYHFLSPTKNITAAYKRKFSRLNNKIDIDSLNNVNVILKKNLTGICLSICESHIPEWKERDMMFSEYLKLKMYQ